MIVIYLSDQMSIIHTRQTVRGAYRRRDTIMDSEKNLI